MFFQKHRQNISSLKNGKHRIVKKSEHRPPLHPSGDKPKHEIMANFQLSDTKREKSWPQTKGKHPAPNLDEFSEILQMPPLPQYPHIYISPVSLLFFISFPHEGFNVAMK